MKRLIVLILTCVFGCETTQRGVLIMAHGGDPAWNESVKAVIRPVREKYPVEVAFGMATPSTMEVALEGLERRGVNHVAVVRMFISGESFLEQTEYILGMRNEAPPPLDASVEAAVHHAGGVPGGDAAEHHCFEPLRQIPTTATLSLSRRGIAESSLIDQILLDRVQVLSTDPGRESVLLLAHGPADDAENERWLAHMRARAQRIHEIGRFRHVECETLREDWPARRAEAQQRIRTYIQSACADGGRAIVVPFRLAGFGPYEEILEGLDYVADGRGLCPHPNITRWIEQTAEECFAGR